MKKKFRRPSPAMVVACIALMVALSGTAAGAVFITKKQAKTIAVTQSDNEITKRAPGLSVASANTANTANNVAANSIGSAQVIDNALNGGDISTVTGATDFDFGSIAAGACLTDAVDVGVDVENDVVLVSPDSNNVFSSSGHLVLYGSDSVAANAIRINVCNVSATTAVDPPSVNFRYIVLRR